MKTLVILLVLWLISLGIYILIGRTNKADTFGHKGLFPIMMFFHKLNLILFTAFFIYLIYMLVYGFWNS